MKKNKISTIWNRIKKKFFRYSADSPLNQNVEQRRLDEEIRFYQKEHPLNPEEKVLKQAGGQDISAI